MFSNNMKGEFLDVFVDSPVYNTSPRLFIGRQRTEHRLKDVPYLDVTAAPRR